MRPGNRLVVLDGGPATCAIDAISGIATFDPPDAVDFSDTSFGPGMTIEIAGREHIIASITGDGRPRCVLDPWTPAGDVPPSPFRIIAPPVAGIAHE